MKLEFAVVYEQTPNNYSAYSPDLPGCISTGETRGDIQETIREAISLHIETMLGDGQPLPEPNMSLEEARSYHCQNLLESGEVLSEFDNDVPILSTTVEMVEIEVALQPA